MGAETTKPSLYNRLGGIYAIATVVDDFIDRIMIDPALNDNPLVDQAHPRASRASTGRYISGVRRWRHRPSLLEACLADAVIPQDNRGRMGRLLQGLPGHAGQFKVPAAEQQESSSLSFRSSKTDIVSVTG